MELADFTKPGEKKKLIWAAALGFIAILFLWWTFIGFGSAKPSATKPITTSQGPGSRPRGAQASDISSAPQVDSVSDLKIIKVSTAIPIVPEPRRNIFAYYEKPPAAPSPTQPPTPTPTPPVLLASISPANVYAKTTDFTLEVAGDRFTSEMRIFFDERELPTKYKGPQQMSASVTAAMIAIPGLRQIKVRTPDAREYSNQIGLTVAPPPTPNYSYVGIFGTPHHVDTALLQDKNNKEILSVQRGDLLSQRFRVTSISEKEVVFVDTNLKIRHSLAMTEGEKTAGSPTSRPTPRVDAEDDEPKL
ncbi:MAG TPA: hypothetical protein VGQ39_15855 [Pyrinomonadaceae bacterium]|jgi:hypothetical protein|nr:hypothetical protein [Pyrinomonadaceae bacterium]